MWGHNAVGFTDSACGVKISDGERRYSDDLLSCSHYLQQDLLVQDGVISKPDNDAAVQVVVSSPL